MRRAAWFTTFAAAAVAIAVSTTAIAQAPAWPNKPVKLIVPFPPGGGTDAFARPLAAQLSKQTGQQFVIDSRGGAGGNIGAELAAKSPNDGYTFLLGAVHHTVAVSVYKKLAYDLEKDLVPVTGVGYVPDVLVVGSKFAPTNIRELIAYSKANPNKVNYGSSGNGTTRHLAGEIFNGMTGSSMVHVPYKGSGPAMLALLGNEIDLIFEGLGCVHAHPCQQDSRVGRDLTQALAGLPGHPDHGRSRRPGFRVDLLVRPVGAGRHAEGSHPETAGGNRHRAGHAGTQGHLGAAGCRAGR